MKVIAKEGERLDSVFFRFYQMGFDQKAYDDFMQTNAMLCVKEVLDGGDEVLFPVVEKEEEQMEGLYGIDV